MPKFKRPEELIQLFNIAKPIRVKYKDIFDLKALYEALHEWLIDRGWEDDEDHSDHWENYYGERIDQSGGREIWITWRCTKKAPAAPFLKYYLDFTWHGIAISKAEVIKDGNKLSVNKGDMEIKIWPFVEKLYEEKFAKNWFLNEFKKLFTKRIYKEELEKRTKELYQEAYELQNFLKQWFKLKRYLPYEDTKSFFSSQAWPSHIREH